MALASSTESEIGFFHENVLPGGEQFRGDLAVGHRRSGDGGGLDAFESILERRDPAFGPEFRAARAFACTWFAS